MINIEGVRVSGIRRSVSAARRETEPRFEIALNAWGICDNSVFVELIPLHGKNPAKPGFPWFPIAGNCPRMTMAELRGLVARAIRALRAATESWLAARPHTGRPGETDREAIYRIVHEMHDHYNREMVSIIWSDRP